MCTILMSGHFLGEAFTDQGRQEGHLTRDPGCSTFLGGNMVYTCEIYRRAPFLTR